MNELTPSQIVGQCSCRQCYNQGEGVTIPIMHLCNLCGNKRCPHATDHTLDCTNSNEPGQTGSWYSASPMKR